MFAQLIDVQYIFNHYAIDDNVDSKLIDPFIITAQDLHIQSILGENLYQSIMNQVASGTFTSSAYQTLLNNYIQPSLMHFAVYEALPFIHFKLTNKSILQMTSDKSVASGLDVAKYLRDNVRNTAEFYNQRIRSHIINNQSQFPEYYSYFGYEQITPRRTTYFSGLYLPKNSNDDYCY